MSELLLIPFGLRISDQQLVDVSEVNKGKKCNCVCPSCNTPLIARHGKVNEWHFAHASKGVSEATQNECEYSFLVSVTLMAKQIISVAKSISIPSLTLHTDNGIKVKVTESNSVVIDRVEIEKRVNSILFDAVLSVGEYNIAIIFTAPHKHFDNCIDSFDGNDKVAILEISLAKAAQWLFESDSQGKYAQILRSNILLKNDCKKWLYHPRQSVIEKRRKEKLYEKIPATSESLNHLKYTIENRQYKCVMCGTDWYGTHKCPNCETHLYSKEVKNT